MFRLARTLGSPPVYTPWARAVAALSVRHLVPGRLGRLIDRLFPAAEA